MYIGRPISGSLMAVLAVLPFVLIVQKFNAEGLEYFAGPTAIWFLLGVLSIFLVLFSWLLCDIYWLAMGQMKDSKGGKIQVSHG